MAQEGIKIVDLKINPTNNRGAGPQKATSTTDAFKSLLSAPVMRPSSETYKDNDTKLSKPKEQKAQVTDNSTYKTDNTGPVEGKEAINTAENDTIVSPQSTQANDANGISHPEESVDDTAAAVLVEQTAKKDDDALVGVMSVPVLTVPIVSGPIEATIDAVLLQEEVPVQQDTVPNMQGLFIDDSTEYKQVPQADIANTVPAEGAGKNDGAIGTQQQSVIAGNNDAQQQLTTPNTVVVSEEVTNVNVQTAVVSENNAVQQIVAPNIAEAAPAYDDASITVVQQTQEPNEGRNVQKLQQFAQVNVVSDNIEAQDVTANAQVVLASVTENASTVVNNNKQQQQKPVDERLTSEVIDRDFMPLVVEEQAAANSDGNKQDLLNQYNNTTADENSGTNNTLLGISDNTATISFENNVTIAPGDTNTSHSRNIQAIATAIKDAHQTKQQQITLNLYPESLGSVDIEIKFSEAGKVQSIKFYTDRQDTLTLLKEGSLDLQNTLREVVTIDDASLTFDLKHGNNNSNHSNEAFLSEIQNSSDRDVEHVVSPTSKPVTNVYNSGGVEGISIRA